MAQPVYKSLRVQDLLASKIRKKYGLLGFKKKIMKKIGFKVQKRFLEKNLETHAHG